MKTTTMTSPLAAPSAPQEIPVKPGPASIFHFQYKRSYGALYTNQHNRFVLREEHVAELKRIVNDYNRGRERRMPVLSVSDVVNAALDFVFEHPVAPSRLGNPEAFGQALAREVYRKAFFHFTRHDVL